MSRRVIFNILLIVALAFIAFDRVVLMLLSPESGLAAAHAVVAVEFVVQTLCYAVVLLVNFRVLLPRLLYHSRIAAYGASLVGFALLFTAIELLFEVFIIRCYNVRPGTFWYFSADSILPFELMSSVAAYTISIAGSAVVVFVAQWQQSGRRMGELERRSAQGDLERERSKIDMQAMFGVLDKVAATVRQAPSAAVQQLMALSQSLREQLYQSHRNQTPVPVAEEEHKTEAMFNLSSPMLKVAVDGRFRWLRYLLLLVLLWMVAGANLDGTPSSVLLALAVALAMLGFVCLNVYVLVNRLLLRGRTKAYVAMLVALIMVDLAIQMAFSLGSLSSISKPLLVLIVCINVVKFLFLFCGTTVFVLFQHWVRNERRIAQLATATLRAELDLLQNQVNPHFLFNMLNAVVVLCTQAPAEAEAVLRKLAEMLRYQHDEFGKQRIRLADDIRFLTDYLNFVKLRRDNFEFTIDVDKSLAGTTLPPMLFIPFVENAVKHNNDSSNLSCVHLRFARSDNGSLHFTCINSKPQKPRPTDDVGGLGLINVRRRLDLLYDKKYRLDICDGERTFEVRLAISD